MRAAEQDAVAPRKHVEAAARQLDVVDLRLRQQKVSCPLIGISSSSANSVLAPRRAVEHDRLVQREELVGRGELANDDATACEEKLAQHR